jgi:hypothetical protein
MNKLASISYVDSLGLPTIFPRIIMPRDEGRVRRKVDSFYYDRTGGWVLRCGEMPDRCARLEGQLPWAIANSKEGLVKSILDMQKDVGARYYVFCHEQAEMIRGGIMLVEGNYVLVEAARGNPHELSAMFRGRRNPEQAVIFNPGMLSFKDEGKSVLGQRDLFELRGVERAVVWQELNAVASPVAVEFSWLANGRFYVHDIRVAA